MPEGLEVEQYRSAAAAVIGGRIRQVTADPRCARDPLDSLRGRSVIAVDRVGKLLMIVTAAGISAGPLADQRRSNQAMVLGIHFGMTGRILIDDRAPIERLEYGSSREEPNWDRLCIDFEADTTRGTDATGGADSSPRRLVVRDPRRLARFTIDPDRSRLGPDVFGISAEELGSRLSGRRRALKAVLLDQGCVAGLGNLCVDEILWHAGLAPRCLANSLGGDEIEELTRVMHRELAGMAVRGGSHTGLLSPSVRRALPMCPMNDGGPLRRTTVAGRTTVWCPHHQRMTAPRVQT